MKPSKRIEQIGTEIEQRKPGFYTQPAIIYMAITQYLDEEWQKTQPNLESESWINKES